MKSEISDYAGKQCFADILFRIPAKPLVGAAVPIPGLDASASSRTHLAVWLHASYDRQGKSDSQRNGTAAARRKGICPLGRSGATKTTWDDTMSAIPSGNSSGRTNTLRQKRIEVRRSSLALQMDYAAGNHSAIGKSQAVPGPALAPAPVHL